jgi:RNA polymerase-binding transcription factor DksA
MSDNTTTNATSASGRPGDDGAIAVQSRADRSLRAQVERTEQQLLELESDMEGMLREHDTIQEDLDQTRTLITNVRADLQRAQRAVARIDAGTFGQCVQCGQPIAVERLEAIPESERCANCA